MLTFSPCLLAFLEHLTADHLSLTSLNYRYFYQFIKICQNEYSPRNLVLVHDGHLELYWCSLLYLCCQLFSLSVHVVVLYTCRCSLVVCYGIDSESFLLLFMVVSFRVLTVCTALHCCAVTCADGLLWTPGVLLRDPVCAF